MPNVHEGSEAHEVQPRGERLKVVASWLVVGLPAAWGVAQVVVKSMALFRLRQSAMSDAGSTIAMGPLGLEPRTDGL